MTPAPVICFNDLPKVEHPPYPDPNLSAVIAEVHQSNNQQWLANFWEARGPATLTGPPRGEELICILDGEAEVEAQGQSFRARCGDVIRWCKDTPVKIIIRDRLLAFCVASNLDASQEKEKD